MNLSKVYYQIGADGKQIFSTLRSAKQHVWMAYTQEERVKELSGESIYKVYNGELVSETKIYVTTDAYFFGKTHVIMD
jgi:hypothetical protein